MYALDTNTLIYFFKGEGNVAGHLLEKPPTEIAIPAVVQYEIETGIAKSKYRKEKYQQFYELLEVVQVLPFDREAATISASVRAQLEKLGPPIGPYDILIAGTALANNAILVSHNTNEFSRIKKLEVEDWYD